MNLKILNFENLIYIILIIFLSVYFKFFENTYIILKSDYHQRLIFNYGFCEKNSYGFIKYIEGKYKLNKNIKIINDESFPRSDGFIYKPKTKYYEDQIILINYDEKKSKVYLKKYQIIEKHKNCFYLKLK